MAGPLVGQVFYTAFGFSGCLYSTTLLLIIAGLASHSFIPERLNHDISKFRKVPLTESTLDVRTTYDD